MGSGLHRLLKGFLFGIAVVAMLSFLVAIAVSRAYWGFYLRRPGIDRRINQVELVQSVTALRSERLAGGSMRFVVHEGYDIAERLRVCQDNRPSISYYCLDERVLAALDDLGKLMEEHERMPATDLARLYHTLETTQLLRQGSPGYDRATELTGIAVLADAQEGQRFLIVGVTGGEVSNDHHPYYEFLFRLPDGSPDPILLSHRSFYYDVAGYEGLHGPRLWLVIFPPAVIALAAVTVVVSVTDVIRVRRRSRIRRA